MIDSYIVHEKLIASILYTTLFYSLSAQDATSTSRIDELLQSLDSIIEETKNPAIGFAVVKGDSTIIAGARGVRDLDTGAEANEETLFRIGSFSKMFVALSVLKLQEERKISLKDKVMDLASEIEYTNPWEETNPILLEHLMEHTTGWNDLHLTEYAHNDPTPATLREDRRHGLDTYVLHATLPLCR
ncbi:MAG: serine hydrolase [Bacteroidota bacterium]